MFTSHDLWWGVALPLGVALVVLALLGAWRWGVALGLAAAYIAGHIAVDGLPGTAADSSVTAADGQVEHVLELLRGLWPHDASDWAVIGALAALAVGLCVSCSCVSPSGAGIGRIVLAFGVVNAVLWPLVNGPWEKVQALVYIQCIIGIALLVWWSVDELAEKVTGAAVPLLLALVVAAAGALMLLNGSQRLGQLTTVMAAALIGAFLVGLFRSGMDLSRGGVAVIMTVTAALLLSAAFYLPDFPMWAALTVALTPVLGWVLLAPPLRRASPAVAVLVTTTITIIALAVALTPSILAFSRSVNEP